MAVISICDANILIDFSKADKQIIHYICEYYDEVYVPDVILAEVGVISVEEAKELGLKLVDSPLELEEIPGLSRQDRTCLYYVNKNKWTCLTNDKLLRKHCVEAGGSVIWGLELILYLVKASLISKDYAENIANKIHDGNPEINQKVLDSFLEKLKSL